MSVALDCVFTLGRLYASTLQVVVTATQCFLNLSKFLEISSHRIFNQFVGSATALAGQLLQAGLGFRTEAYFHESKSKSRGLRCQSSSLFHRFIFPQCSHNRD